MVLSSSHLSYICVGIVCTQLVRRILPWLYLNIFGPTVFGPKIDLCGFGTWAIVTGATNGIGKSYVKALAKKGLNVVLISRSLSKLEALAKEITDTYKVKVKTIDIDFTDGPEIYQKIQKNIEGLDIGVLVNNVGISYAYPEFFIKYTTQHPEFLRDIVSVNIHSVTHMCALILPNMIAKKKGVIINVSSILAVIPSPCLSAYSGSKAFVDKFTEDLQTEYQSQGIIVQSVRSGYIAKITAKFHKPTLFAPSNDTFVASALKTIGIAGHTAGYLPYAVMQLIIQSFIAVGGEQIVRNIILNINFGIKVLYLSVRR